MARSASTLGIIVAAARSGRVSAAGARRWAQRAASGEDVSFVGQLAKAGPGVAGADLSRLTTDVVSILAGSVTAVRTPRGGEMPDAEADLLYPPRTSEAAEARFSAAEAERAARSYTDAELHAELFGGHTYAGAAGHEALTGTHTHTHPSYGGGQHSHEHEHNGDADHGHHGGTGQVGEVQR